MHTLTKQPETPEDSRFLADLPANTLDQLDLGGVYAYIRQSDMKPTPLMIVIEFKKALGIVAASEEDESKETTTTNTKVISNAIIEATELTGFFDPDTIKMVLIERRDALLAAATPEA